MPYACGAGLRFALPMHSSSRFIHPVIYFRVSCVHTLSWPHLVPKARHLSSISSAAISCYLSSYYSLCFTHHFELVHHARCVLVFLRWYMAVLAQCTTTFPYCGILLSGRLMVTIFFLEAHPRLEYLDIVRHLVCINITLFRKVMLSRTNDDHQEIATFKAFTSVPPWPQCFL